MVRTPGEQLAKRMAAVARATMQATVHTAVLNAVRPVGERRHLARASANSAAADPPGPGTPGAGTPGAGTAGVGTPGGRAAAVASGGGATARHPRRATGAGAPR